MSSQKSCETFLEKRRRKMRDRGHQDALQGLPPAVAEWSYIKGYEEIRAIKSGCSKKNKTNSLDYEKERQILHDYRRKIFEEGTKYFKQLTGEQKERSIKGKVKEYDPTTNIGVVETLDRDYRFHITSYASLTHTPPRKGNFVEIILNNEGELLRVRIA